MHTLISINFEWPTFSHRKFAPRCDGFVGAVAKSGAHLIAGQEMGPVEFKLFLARLRDRLGDDWSGARATAPGSANFGLNVVFWRRLHWEVDGKLIDILLPGFGQYARTFVAAPLEHENGEKITLGASHFANTAAKDLDVKPLVAQAKQAEAVHEAVDDRRRVVTGIDSNNKTNLFGGRRYLVKHDWTLTGNGIDIVACRPGVVAQSKRTVAIPSDHKKALVVALTTNPQPTPKPEVPAA